MSGLPPAADYGAIPFDLFALGNWKYSLPPDDDERQWNNLVQKYLDLPERDRFPWHRWGGEVHPHPTPTTENVTRVLRPHQTPQERRISAHVSPPCYNFVWLRTCYDPELQSQYDELLRASGAEGDLAMGREWVLDDATLYDFGSERSEIVTRIVRRIPSLCDTYWASVEEDYDYRVENESADESELVRASNRVRSGVCVADEGAIKEQMVKIFWLGEHGQCLWHNEVEPDMVEEMSGTFKGGYSLSEGVGTLFTEGERG
ncbi:uncharacterized protein DNG_07754 [Cephalotrichum gorgonifer]|uniref:Uncharacterized protein n=1 Tax=Cephalotrichum gorgonifer TaxID=2041049 RepID=A0AAE8SXS6_9PEZI|nr:uncharacterized protein DNG_07754 [Cephalotrichum gorgonifer]